MRIINIVGSISLLALILFSCGEPFKTSVKYEAFLLKDYAKADYFVPHPETINAPCDKITPESIDFEKKLMPGRDFSTIKDSCRKEVLTCSGLKFQGMLSNNQGWGDLKAPLYSLEVWDQLFPKIPIKINAMFFEVENLAGWPHLMPCTNIFGFSKASNGKFIDNQAPNFPIDYFVIYKDLKTQRSKIKLIENSELNDTVKMEASAILNGFILVKNSKYIYGKEGNVPTGSFKNVGDCKNRFARTVIGFKGNDLYVITAPNLDRQKFGATCQEIAEIAIQKYGLTDLFAFDGGGSSGIFAKNLESGNFIFKSPAWDKQGYRPLPSILGITPQNFRQFIYLTDYKE